MLSAWSNYICDIGVIPLWFDKPPKMIGYNVILI